MRLRQKANKREDWAPILKGNKVLGGSQSQGVDKYFTLGLCHLNDRRNQELMKIFVKSVTKWNFVLRVEIVITRRVKNNSARI